MSDKHFGLLGFDARQPMQTSPLPYRAQELHLFRNDIKTFSVDTLIWPSLVDHLPQFPQWVGPFHPLWEDSDKLNAFCQANLSGAPAVIITVHRAHRASGGFEFAARPGRQLVGFDVADEGLISGLMNCGLGHDSGARETWAPLLNEYHLFNELPHAQSFANYANARVPEHAPFFPYAVEIMDGSCADA